MNTVAAGTHSEVAEPQARSRVRGLRALAYCSILILLPALFLLSSIPIVRSASFPQISGDPFLLHPEYAASLKNVNCRIVVFGDSTAVTGIDPTEVERLTGLKTCNIAQSQSILALLGMKALDEYLGQNQPPQYLVIQLAPETFARNRQDFFWPEGLALLLRQDFGWHALYVLATNPAQTYGFALWAIKLQIDAFFSPPDFRETNEIFRERHGLLVLPKPPETACSMHWDFYPPDARWVSSLRTKYSSGSTRVLVNVTSIPSCDRDVGRIASSLQGITDNHLSAYPIHLFNDRDRHLTLEGAERASAELAQQILKEEAGKK